MQQCTISTLKSLVIAAWARPRCSLIHCTFNRTLLVYTFRWWKQSCTSRQEMPFVKFVGGFHVNLYFCRILVQQYQLEKSMKPLVKACFTLIFMSIFVSSLTSRMLQLQQLMDKESGHLTFTGREGFVGKGRLEMSGVALEWEFEQGNWSSHRWIFGRCRKTWFMMHC